VSGPVAQLDRALAF